jgi:hypothetical protein
MTARFVRASIVPFDEAGKEPVEDEAVLFDFNPETLTLKTSAPQSRDGARQGRQQVQNVGTTSATLNFEAVFDSTRPRDGEDGRAPITEEELDVRVRTRPLALLIQSAESEGASGDKKAQPAPKRVQFRWGSIIFNGLITSYQETFDYFAPGGVPLRSKVQLTLTEQEFRYEIDSKARAAEKAAGGPSPQSARDAASAAGADSLFDLSLGLSFGLSVGFAAGFSAGFSADFSFGFEADFSLEAEFGLDVDIGLSVGAGISLSADVAVDVFGPEALGTGGATAGKAGISAKTASTGGSAAAEAPKGSIAIAPNPWAPDGPAPGSQAAAITAIVIGNRAAGIALAAPNTPEVVNPLPPRGSPPPALPRAPTGIAPIALRSAPREMEWTGDRRPRWEALGVAPPRFATGSVTTRMACGCGCGCARCGGA